MTEMKYQTVKKYKSGLLIPSSIMITVYRCPVCNNTTSHECCGAELIRTGFLPPTNTGLGECGMSLIEGRESDDPKIRELANIYWPVYQDLVAQRRNSDANWKNDLEAGILKIERILARERSREANLDPDARELAEESQRIQRDCLNTIEVYRRLLR